MRATTLYFLLSKQHRNKQKICFNHSLVIPVSLSCDVNFSRHNKKWYFLQRFFFVLFLSLFLSCVSVFCLFFHKYRFSLCVRIFLKSSSYNNYHWMFVMLFNSCFGSFGVASTLHRKRSLVLLIFFITLMCMCIAENRQETSLLALLF